MLNINDAHQNFGAASKTIVFLICATIVVAVVLFGMVDAGTMALFCFGAGAVGWLWLIDAWQTGELRYSKNLLQLPLAGLIIIGLFQLLPFGGAIKLPENLLSQPASTTLSLNPFATRLAVVQLAAMLIYFAAALVFINTVKRLRAVANIIIILGFVMSVAGIIQHFGGGSKALWLRDSPQALPFASFINRHHFGAMMEMTIALTLGLLYTKAVNREKLLLYVFAVVIMGIALVLTSSRGAALSLLALILFLTATVFLERQKNRSTDARKNLEEKVGSNRLILLGSGFALIVTIFAAVWLLGDETSVLRSIGASGGAGDLSSGRWQFWQTSFLMIRDFPFLGVGLDAFGVAYTRYDTMNGVFRIEQAHNDYLQVLAEAGIGGLILILVFIFLLFRSAWQVLTTAPDRFRRGVSVGALAGCFGIMIHSFFDFPLRTPANLLMFLILAALATVPVNLPKV